MSITIEELRGIASLARLDLTPEEESLFAEQLDSITRYVAELGEASAEGSEVGVRASVLGVDRPVPGLSAEVALANAPKSFEGFFLVPPMKSVDEGSDDD